MDPGGRMRADVVVAGAGITGLAAAVRLARAGARVTVLEAARAVGGALRTVSDGDWLFELGPNTVLARPPLRELLDTTGLGAEVVEASPAGKRRYLWKRDRLEPLPAAPLGLLSSPLFPARAKLALLREPFVGRGPAAAPGGAGDESIAEFVRRRFGQPWLDYAVGPFVSGVYAGDPERLSVRWAVPRIAALEREHGSLLRGALAGRGGGAAARGAMMGYRGGFGRLAQRLAAGLSDVRTGAAATAISRAEDHCPARSAM